MSDYSSIEVHGHFIPPVYRQALVDTGLIGRDRFPVPPWDAQLHLDFMSKMDVSAAVLSLSSPDVLFDDEVKTRALYRSINEAGSELVRDHPDKFGYFASLPLPDFPGSLEELDYAYQSLNVDGIRLTTNTKGLYLGEAALEPLFERLNHYKAVIYIHPCMPGAVPANVLAGYPVPMMEFLFDTARAVTNLILNGVVARYPDIRYVIPHAGGVLPILVPRINGIVQITRKPEDRADVLGGFRSLYYDVAGPSIMQQLQPLLNVTDDTHLVYGTDWPFAPASDCEAQKAMLVDTDQITDEQKRKIFRNNALALFPRFS
jgi:predicted TIM-barrel fold metal-dependent hydrolase